MDVRVNVEVAVKVGEDVLVGVLVGVNVDVNVGLAEVYADADLFVFTSPTETCGLVVLEAMASGLPVITSDRGGVLENVRHAINGLMVPAGAPEAFAAATVDLIRDRRARTAMGSAARAFAVARDWERELDALEPMYRDAIAAVA